MRRAFLLLGWLCSLVLIMAACGGGGDQEAASVPEPTAKTTSAPKMASPIPEEGQPLSPGKYVTPQFKPAVSFRILEVGWVVLSPQQPDYFDIAQPREDPSEPPLLIAFSAPDKVYEPERLPKQVPVPEPKDWVAWFRNHPYLKTGKATPVTVGGVSGVQFETQVSSAPRKYPEYCPAACIPVWPQKVVGPVLLALGVNDRITILKVKGETVIIDVAAPEDNFEKRFQKAHKVLDTVEWKGE